MQYQTILFDLDGTLTDSAPGILNSVRYACRKLGLPLPGEAQLRGFLGPPLPWSFRTILGLGEADAARAVAAFREYYPETEYGHRDSSFFHRKLFHHYSLSDRHNCTAANPLQNSCDYEHSHICGNTAQRRGERKQNCREQKKIFTPEQC